MGDKDDIKLLEGQHVDKSDCFVRMMKRKKKGIEIKRSFYKRYFRPKIQ